MACGIQLQTEYSPKQCPNLILLVPPGSAESEFGHAYRLDSANANDNPPQDLTLARHIICEYSSM